MFFPGTEESAVGIIVAHSPSAKIGGWVGPTPDWVPGRSPGGLCVGAKVLEIFWGVL